MPILDTSSSSTQPTKATSTTTSAPSQNMPGLYVNKSHHHQSNNLVKPASQMISCKYAIYATLQKQIAKKHPPPPPPKVR